MFKVIVPAADGKGSLPITTFKEDGTVISAEGTLSVELIRWTFTVKPEKRVEIETHLLDLGLEILARGDDALVVTWDEPDGGVEDLIEELWAMHGEPFEITHEEFHRASLLIYHPEETVEQNTNAGTAAA
ncbi:MAG TPA: hypothetical protein VJY33_16435 [Isosphaeraceae bacterium]|nr:hypothetical protein [Isosphaeraceae bacterium]